MPPTDIPEETYTLIAGNSYRFENVVCKTGAIYVPPPTVTPTDHGNTASNSVQQLFKALVRDWKSDCGPLSTVRAMTLHPAYKKIIGLGEEAVPLLLEELQREPDHWFVALRAITGANPVSSEHRGDLSRMAEAWIRWGEENGYRR